MAPYRLTDPAVLPFIVIPVLLVIALVWCTFVAWTRVHASRTAVIRACLATAFAAVSWMALTWAAAAAGILRQWDRSPPPFALLVLGVALVSVALAFGTIGRQIADQTPLWVLVAIQSFRLPLELSMHALSERGIMPVQMSYTGRNFDILTGATAVLVALLVKTGRAGRGLVAVWNVLGLGLLMNVVVVAILSTPRFRYFGDDRLNVFVTYPPFVWLPAVMVVAALAGHLVVFSALLRRPNRRRPGG
jgi:hypothetical protein